MKTKGWKRIATWILVVLFTAAMLFVLGMPLVYAADDGMAVYAANDGATVIGDGQMGDNVYWKLTADGVLTVYGTGATWDYSNPWRTGVWEEKEPGYRNDWKCVRTPNGYIYPESIVITEGVTHIGDNTFGYIETLKEVTMADSVTSIGNGAFCRCKSMNSIVLSRTLRTLENFAFAFDEKMSSLNVPDTITDIGDFAFYGCVLSDIYYAGTKEQWQDINISSKEDGNAALLNANLHFGADEPSAWAKAEVNAAIGAGLVPENLQKNYQTAVSRGEVAEMFVKLLEKSSGKTIDAILAEKGASVNPGTFSDSSDKNVLAANALGIINGTGNGKFSPDGTLTRAQIAAIINRTANVLGVETKGYTHKFTDVSGHWVSSELGWPAKAGIINGVGDNKFDPDGKLTTEQAIAITNRALNVLKK